MLLQMNQAIHKHQSVAVVQTRGGKSYKFAVKEPVEVPDDAGYEILSLHPTKFEQVKKISKPKADKMVSSSPENKAMGAITGSPEAPSGITI